MMFDGFQGAFNCVPMMPRDASLSESYTSDRCSFSSLVWKLSSINSGNDSANPLGCKLNTFCGFAPVYNVCILVSFVFFYSRQQKQNCLNTLCWFAPVCILLFKTKTKLLEHNLSIFTSLWCLYSCLICFSSIPDNKNKIACYLWWPVSALFWMINIDCHMSILINIVSHLTWFNSLTLGVGDNENKNIYV